MVDRETLTFAIRQQQSLVDHMRGSLYRRAKGLADDLAALAEKIANDPDALVNSLGEVQAAGPMVDVHCARFCEARGHLKALQELRGDRG
jgi:hypothetical protein